MFPKEDNLQIKIANRHISKAVDMLEGMELKGSDSRARTRLIGLLKPVAADVAKHEKSLMAEYMVTDTEQRPIVDGEGNITFADGYTLADYLDAHNELLDEVADIQGGTTTTHRQQLIDMLTAWDTPLAGERANTYDALLTALEEGND